jgi:hypothetical protein
MLMTQILGWVATAIFAGSYFLRPAALRAIQMVAAVLWIVYGVLIDATLARVLCGIMNSLALRARAGDSRATLEATA